jgi:hypothetical protein
MPGATIALAGAEDAGPSATREPTVVEVGFAVVDDGPGVTGAVGVACDRAVWRLWISANSAGSGAGAACAGMACGTEATVRCALAEPTATVEAATTRTVTARVRGPGLSRRRDIGPSFVAVVQDSVCACALVEPPDPDSGCRGGARGRSTGAEDQAVGDGDDAGSAPAARVGRSGLQTVRAVATVGSFWLSPRRIPPDPRAPAPVPAKPLGVGEGVAVGMATPWSLMQLRNAAMADALAALPPNPPVGRSEAQA